MNFMELLVVWLIVGALTGWIAFLLSPIEQTPYWDMFLCIVASAVSGFGYLSLTSPEVGGPLSIIVAFLGACIMASVWRVFMWEHDNE